MNRRLVKTQGIANQRCWDNSYWEPTPTRSTWPWWSDSDCGRKLL